MEKKGQHSIYKAYLGQYMLTAVMFAAYVAIFAIIFSLYYLEMEAVLYASGLCVVLTVIVLSVHFWSYRRKHLERYEILMNIELMTDSLPRPETLAESDYQDMIIALKQIYNTHLTTWQNRQNEHMDYYTTWVHQIKSPISVMRMMLQAEDTKEHRELSAELFRIEQYVEMVLSYLRLGSETSDFVIAECALDDIIRQAVHKYAPQFIRKRIQLRYEPTDVAVLTDEKWLLFIIEQLLSNAVKYTLKGSITITASPEKVLSISDTGIGIAPEDIPRIFEKGFTGYNGRADKKSTGLGLYLCQMAAGKLSHTINVESKVGCGTTFLVDMGTYRLDVRE